LRLWNVGLPAVENFLYGHERRVQDLAYYGERLYSVSVDGTLKIWEAGELVQSFSLPDSLFAISLSADANEALLASRDGAYLLNLSTGDYRLLNGQSGRITDVILLGNQRALGAASGNEVVLWDTETGEILRHYEHNAGINTIALMPNGEQFLAAASDGSLSLWNIATGVSVRSFTGNGSSISSIAISPNGLVAATASRDGYVIFWDVLRGIETSRVVVGSDVVWSVAFNASGSKLAIGASQGLIIVWDMARHSEIARYDLGTSHVFTVAFSPDAQHLATGQDDASVLVWRVYTLDELIDWVDENRYLRPWHCVELEQYHLPDGTACES
jgi:WD40 repeat protein